MCTGSSGADSDGISRLHTCDLNTTNHARMETNLERARRILGMTTRPISTEDLVLVRLRATAEQEEIDASVLQCYSNCKIGVLQGHGSHTPPQDEGWRSL